MSEINVEKKEVKQKLYFLEVVKWCSVVTLFMMAVFGNYLYRHYSVLLRGIIIVFFTVVATYLASTTKLGKLLVIFGQESYVELKQVVWPTYRDGLNTTFVVVGVTVIVSLILWGLDAVIVNLISFGLRL